MDVDDEPHVSGVLPHQEGSSSAAKEAGDEQLELESHDAELLGQSTPDDHDDDAPAHNGGDVPLSKNQQKKLKRQQKWEDMRGDRKRRRKEKRLTKKAQRQASKTTGGAEENDGAAAATPAAPKEHALVPVSLIFDCAFESYMRENELISLSSQITRSYSANRTAARCTRIYVSSWGGKLKNRYETLLTNQHKRWPHVYFLEDDFVAAAREADAAMRGEDGGTIVDVLEAKEENEEKDGTDETDKAEEGAGEGEAEEKGDGTSATPSVVYLTSDSPHTLTRLEPYTSYVIGGIVDKNREKGLCYGRAQARGIRTAKLPIGDYMVMASRQVLTTNHVVEIMLSWLETGDWATAFTNVIPKRKGGHLRGEGGEGDEDGEEKGEGGAVDEGAVDGQDDGDEAALAGAGDETAAAAPVAEAAVSSQPI